MYNKNRKQIDRGTNLVLRLHKMGFKPNTRGMAFIANRISKTKKTDDEIIKEMKVIIWKDLKAQGL